MPPQAAEWILGCKNGFILHTISKVLQHQYRWLMKTWNIPLESKRFEGKDNE